MGRLRVPTSILEARGSFLHNPQRRREREGEILVDGRPIRPKFLTGRAAELFDELAAIGYWLSAADSMLLAAFSALTAELEGGIEKMSSARIQCWNRIGASLAFDPGARSRLGIHPPLAPAPPATRNRTSKYFPPT